MINSVMIIVEIQSKAVLNSRSENVDGINRKR